MNPSPNANPPPVEIVEYDTLSLKRKALARVLIDGTPRLATVVRDTVLAILPVSELGNDPDQALRKLFANTKWVLPGSGAGRTGTLQLKPGYRLVGVPTEPPIVFAQPGVRFQRRETPANHQQPQHQPHATGIDLSPLASRLDILIEAIADLSVAVRRLAERQLATPAESTTASTVAKA